MPLEISLAGLEDAIAILEELQKRGEDLTVPLDMIGENEATKTDRRFKRAIDPDGTAWEPVPPRPNRIAGNEKPLRDTDRLKDSITHRLYGRLAVGIGVKGGKTQRSVGNRTTIADAAEYGKYHQFGWGVKKRRFLGVDQDSKNDIMDILNDYFIFI